VTHPKAYWLTCILTVLWASIAGATTIVMPTDEQLIAKSPLIVEGTVVHSAAVDRGNAIWTETTVSVANVIKGQLPVTGEQLPGQPATGNGQQLTIREIGGVLDNRITKIFGAPEYHDGEHVLLFLTPTPRGDYQTVDLYVGKFAEDKAGDLQRKCGLSNTACSRQGHNPVGRNEILQPLHCGRSTNKACNSSGEVGSRTLPSYP